VVTSASVDEDVVREYLRAMNPGVPDGELDDIDWSIFHQGECCAG
jgi:hypothetical protein